MSQLSIIKIPSAHQYFHDEVCGAIKNAWQPSPRRSWKGDLGEAREEVPSVLGAHALFEQEETHCVEKEEFLCSTQWSSGETNRWAGADWQQKKNPLRCVESWSACDLGKMLLLLLAHNTKAPESGKKWERNQPPKNTQGGERNWGIRGPCAFSGCCIGCKREKERSLSLTLHNCVVASRAPSTDKQQIKRQRLTKINLQTQRVRNECRRIPTS